MGRWLLGMILLAIISLMLAWVGPISAPQQAEKMERSIQDALNTAGLSDVKVKMNGHVAELSGTTMSTDAANKAVDIAKATHCTHCRNSKPIWHEVAGKLSVEKPAAAVEVPEVNVVSPYTFTATKRGDGNLLLDGYVRSDAEKNRILREARQLFGDGVTDNQLTVAEGAPNASWGDIITKYLPILNDMEMGSLSLDDAQALLTGRVDTEALRNQIYALRDADLGFNEVANVSVPNAPAMFAGTGQSARVCQTLFNQLKGDAKIQFDTDSDVIKSDSFGLLERLTSAARQCPDFQVKIDGHTDNTGDPDYNLDLSHRRADRVVAYLTTQGIDALRLSSEGHGQNRPIADNATEDGKAANRRIEFTVSKSE